jgi:hypothetical protein
LLTSHQRLGEKLSGEDGSKYRSADHCLHHNSRKGLLVDLYLLLLKEETGFGEVGQFAPSSAGSKQQSQDEKAWPWHQPYWFIHRHPAKTLASMLVYHIQTFLLNSSLGAFGCPNLN